MRRTTRSTGNHVFLGCFHPPSLPPSMMLHQKEHKARKTPQHVCLAHFETEREYCKNEVSEMYGSLLTNLGSLYPEAENLAQSESLAVDEYLASTPIHEAQILAAANSTDAIASRTRGYFWSTSNRCSSTCWSRCQRTAFFSLWTCQNTATKSSTMRQSTRLIAVAATSCADFPL